MIDVASRRRFFAEEIEAVARLRSASLVDALATIPRERFLPPGPWTVLADVDFTGLTPAKTRLTPDADAARVYHNIAIAIDPSRQLFNGQPATLAPWIDALDITPGSRVLHIGAGLGYYTAIMAHCTGAAGRVLAFEADPALAAAARVNLAPMPWVRVRETAASALDETFDVILVNAGVTHPLDAWLDALAPGGRMVLPLTASFPAMGPIGKGFVFLLRRQDDGFAAAVNGFVAIYSAVGVRDEFVNGLLGTAMMAGPQKAQQVTRLRRDRHEPELACCAHAVVLSVRLTRAGAAVSIRPASSVSPSPPSASACGGACPTTRRRSRRRVPGRSSASTTVVRPRR
jgi:protein-L-isoaspartate(D-aspartate) O-methyltransferase